MSITATKPSLPELPLGAWQDTKTTLHLFTQIIGKVRLTLHPKLNHWWHAPLYVSSRGLTTRTIPLADRSIDLELDLVDHALTIRGSEGQTESIRLHDGLSVAEFYRQTLAGLGRLGVTVDLVGRPFDPARAGSDLPFPEDQVHARYDPNYANRFWRILRWVDGVLTEFKGRFVGKSTPVHFFWHSFDLAYTRFSGRRAPQREGLDPVTREAYSHEVISFGFWPGDDNVPAPAFYAYVSPEPEGLASAALAPATAFWRESAGSAMALLMYDDLRRTTDPRGALLDFLESAYLAAATRPGWDVEAFKNEYVDYQPPELG